jgi:dTDP-4-dehydrorhamnose reductase
VGPINEYGASKFEGEMKIVLSGCHHVILRTSWVYAPEGSNFVRTMLRLAADRESLGIVADQIGSPSSALDLARAVLDIMTHPSFVNRSLGGFAGRETQAGIFNVAGDGTTSWYDFALEIFAKAKALGILIKVKDIRKLKTVEYPTPAERPLNSRLDQSKILQQFGLKLPSWKSSLSVVLEEVFARDIGR